MAPPQPRPGILEIAPYVGGESRLPGIAQPVKLSSNEAALGPSPKALAAYQAAGARLARYPESDSGRLRAALAQRWKLDAARIVCGNGSDEILSLLTHAYAGPGDEVLFARHSFLVYEIAARFAGATPVVVAEKNLKVDVDALLAALTPRTRIVFLTNPGNPTGSYLTKSEVERLHKNLPGHVLLILDSAYAEFVSADDFCPGTSWVAKSDNVVMTRTFSKIYGLAGLRLGWAYAPSAIADILNRVRGPFNVTLPAQEAGLAALEDTAFVEKALENNTRWRDWLSAELAKIGLLPAPSVTNFILVRFPDEAARNAKAADAFLRTRGIIVRRVDNYGLAEYLRISIGTENEMRATAKALGDFMRAS